MALSSAILYLAIVAIWAIVLVPRWLRPPQASGTLESNLAEPVAASPLEDLAEADDDTGGGDGPPAPGTKEAGAEPATPPAAGRRERVLQARRRMLLTLTAITAGAAAIVLVHLAAPWVVIPPAVMLAGFVLLLRDAARSDAERAFEAAWRRERATGADAAAADGADRQQTGLAGGAQAEVASPQAEAPSPPAGVPSAQIIDISGRVGDQLYDQYADAEVRAVGD
jgi:hypothetical protein